MFTFAKITGMILQPGIIFVLMLLLSVLLSFSPWAKAGRRIGVLTAVIALLITIVPWGLLLIRPLEDRFPPPQVMPEHVDGIIILGGVFHPELSLKRNQPSGNASFERITTLMELARRYPNARLLFTGGSASILDNPLKEAPVAENFLYRVGFDTSRVIFEDESRNTRENALFSQRAMAPLAGETWLLVTSARHMPRSMGTFRAVGWDTVAYPVDYLTTGERKFTIKMNFEEGLRNLSEALHEFQGLLYYRWNGWIQEIWPGPDPEKTQ